MKEKKITFKQFMFFDRSGIKKYMEKMARQGWLLKKINIFGYEFKRIEPKEIKFAVTYFSDGTKDNENLSEKELEYKEFCEYSGWKFVAKKGKMQIYCNENINPVELETDAVVEVETIHNTMKNSFLRAYYVMIILGLINIIGWFADILENTISVLMDNFRFIGALCGVFQIVIGIIGLAVYYSWYKKAKKKAEFDGRFVETKGAGNVEIGIFAIFIILLIGSIGFSFIKLKENERKPVDTYVSNGVEYEIFKDDVPLTSSDIWEVDKEYYSSKVTEYSSIFANVYDIEENVIYNSEESLDYPNINYRITEFKVSGIKNLWLEDLLKEYNEKRISKGNNLHLFCDYVVEVENEIWEAEKVYRQGSSLSGGATNGYIVCWEDKILEIKFSVLGEVEDEIIKKVVEKFKDW